MEKECKFNPKAIMVDDNVTNYIAIEELFGVDFLTSKVIRYQMHYKNGVTKASLRLGVSFRGKFKNICNKMCTVATVTQYSEQKKLLEEMVNLFPDITRWVAWWDARKYHTFVAFRRFRCSSIMLAKNSNSTLKCQTQLWLLEATQDDMSAIVMQNEELRSFLAQAATSG